jgi:hypothetical protein
MKQIEILGKSFCGSTLLCFVLGSLPDVLGIGELHSIFTHGTKVAGKVQPGMCCVCWEKCKYLTPDFLSSLTRDNIMLSLISQFNKGIIVMSNKDVCFWMNENISDYNPAYILLFKSPEAQIKSFLHKLNNRFDLTQCINFYLGYEQLINYLIGSKKVFMSVSYELLTTNLEYELKRMCNFFHLSYDPVATAYWKCEHHVIRGNGGPYVNIRPKEGIEAECSSDERYAWYTEHYKKIEPDESWKTVLTENQKRIIGEHSGLQMLYNKMMGWARIPYAESEGEADRRAKLALYCGDPGLL